MPVLDNNIMFKFGLQANYNAITSKDVNTVYFTTDTQRLFVGDVEYTRPIQHGTALPTDFLPPESFFYHETEKTLYYSKDGESWDKCSNFYVHPAFTAKSSGMYKITVDAQGHISAATAVTKTDLTGLGLPGSNTTYTFSEGDANGQIKVTPSGGTAQNVAVKGLGSAAYTESSAYATAAQGTLASNAMPKSGGTFTGLITLSGAPTSNLHAATKKYVDDTVNSKVSSVFKYIGTVETVSELPTENVVEGSVYHVKATHSEYVYAKVDGATTASWEELGGVIDLSAYAKSAEVIQRVSSASGMVPKFNADGTLSSTGFTLGVSVPVNAKFTDTVYTHPAGSAVSKASGLYKFSTDSKSHISAVTAVTKADITALGIPGQDTTYSAFTGATAEVDGTAGLVVAPTKGNQSKFLKADGTWATPTNTTYAGDRGISLVSGKFGHTNTAITANTTGVNTNGTLSWGSATTLNTIKYDAYGHVTGTGTFTLTMPANPNTDTKVHNKARGTTKAYLLGTTTAPTATNVATTAVSETGVYFDTVAGTLVATTFKGALSGNASSATTATNATKLGNVAAADYALKTDITNAALKWGTF